MTTPTNVTPTINERIITTTAEALGWTVERTMATQDPNFAPDSYRPALFLKRGDPQFIVFLDDIEGDADQIRDEIHFVLRLIARYYQDVPWASPDTAKEPRP